MNHKDCHSEAPCLNWYRIDPQVPVPRKATDYSSCVDLVVSFKSFRDPNLIHNDKDGKRYIVVGSAPTLVGTGLIVDIPMGYELDILIRSGAALKQGLMLVNSVGVIDEDYVNELGLIIACHYNSGYTKLYEGQRVAQARLKKRLFWVDNEVEQPPKTKTNREGGFGSTGI